MRLTVRTDHQNMIYCCHDLKGTFCDAHFIKSKRGECSHVSVTNVNIQRRTDTLVSDRNRQSQLERRPTGQKLKNRLFFTISECATGNQSTTLFSAEVVTEGKKTSLSLGITQSAVSRVNVFSTKKCQLFIQAKLQQCIFFQTIVAYIFFPPQNMLDI